MPKIYQLLTDEIEEFVLQYINEHQLNMTNFQLKENFPHR